MHLDTFIQSISRSKPEDWVTVSEPIFLLSRDNVPTEPGEKISDDWRWPQHNEIHTLRSNLGISIATGLGDPDPTGRPWVQKAKLDKTWAEAFDLLWNGRPIVRGFRLYVGHAAVSLPLLDTLEVPRRLVSIVRLINELEGLCDDFDAWADRLGLVYGDDPWP